VEKGSSSAKGQEATHHDHATVETPNDGTIQKLSRAASVNSSVQNKATGGNVQSKSNPEDARKSPLTNVPTGREQSTVPEDSCKRHNSNSQSKSKNLRFNLDGKKEIEGLAENSSAGTAPTKVSFSDHVQTSRLPPVPPSSVQLGASMKRQQQGQVWKPLVESSSTNVPQTSGNRVVQRKGLLAPEELVHRVTSWNVNWIPEYSGLFQIVPFFQFTCKRKYN
jgi:hypothetical protein